MRHHVVEFQDEMVMGCGVSIRQMGLLGSDEMASFTVRGVTGETWQLY